MAAEDKNCKPSHVISHMTWAPHIFSWAPNGLPKKVVSPAWAHIHMTWAP